MEIRETSKGNYPISGSVIYHGDVEIGSTIYRVTYHIKTQDVRVESLVVTGQDYHKTRNSERPFGMLQTDKGDGIFDLGKLKQQGYSESYYMHLVVKDVNAALGVFGEVMRNKIEHEINTLGYRKQQYENILQGIKKRCNVE